MANKKLLIFIIVIIGFSSISFAQPPSNVSAFCTIRILKPMTITKDLDLRFGTVVTGNAAGTVVIGITGAAVRNLGTYTDIVTGADSFGAAQFTVRGTPNERFGVSLPVVNVLLTGPGTSLIVNAFTTNHDSSVDRLNGLGNKIILVGATLNIPANQLAGAYSGTFSVTVSYN